MRHGGSAQIPRLTMAETAPGKNGFDCESLHYHNSGHNPDESRRSITNLISLLTRTGCVPLISFDNPRCLWLKTTPIWKRKFLILIRHTTDGLGGIKICTLTLFNSSWKLECVRTRLTASEMVVGLMEWCPFWGGVTPCGVCPNRQANFWTKRFLIYVYLWINFKEHIKAFY